MKVLFFSNNQIGLMFSWGEQFEGRKYICFEFPFFFIQILSKPKKKLNEGIRESEESFCDCEKPVRDHEYSDCCGRCGDVIKEQNDAERT